jgi:hypothetical protein
VAAADIDSDRLGGGKPVVCESENARGTIGRWSLSNLVDGTHIPSLGSGGGAAGQMSGQPEDSLFPLRFTPFEFYYLLEDRPDYPSAFPIYLECRGTLDREAFARAFHLAHVRHPLLSADIELDKKQWPYWVAREPPTVRWTDDLRDCRSNSTAVASSSGLQLHVRQEGDKTRWMFLFHHCSVDGMGAFLFISDLFVAYAHCCSDSPDSPPPRALDSMRLRDRDGHQLFNRKIKLIDLVRLVRVNVPLNLRRAAVVSNDERPQQNVATVGNASDDLVHHLTEHETAELSRVASALSVMLNDLLVRDYFLTLSRWNRGSSEARRPIRVMVPTNLRRREDYRMPAANVFSFAFLTRRVRDCENRESLLASIRDEMAMIKRNRLGLYFEAGLRMFSAWPPLLAWSLKRKWTFATAIFSNLGTGLDNVPLPLRGGRRACGDLVFEGGSGAAPLRPGTRVSFAVHTYAGRLAICVRCDPQWLSPAQHRGILDAYVDQLCTTIASGS